MTRLADPILEALRRTSAKHQLSVGDEKAMFLGWLVLSGRCVSGQSLHLEL